MDVQLFQHRSLKRLSLLHCIALAPCQRSIGYIYVGFLLCFTDLFFHQDHAVLITVALYRHILFYCALLYCTLQILHFLQIEGLWHCAWSKSISGIFPTAFANFVSLCHILVIPTIFQFIMNSQSYSLRLYLSWRSPISDI